ncbi:hypothetical protein [Natronobacterium texcoconense]|uniref:Uncharacterized protein n=1 Tax=Natronobacterium texcoconense TaxID=1095778 RepID=A0A1H0Z5V1_NATTX|nr:hypothetical protein [Natronobacterium texcoconense]SDQ22793.1 hypothetical protein SAMN04489842_0146 [Natronobacterium texcoconense]
MLDTNHSSGLRIDTAINERARERLPTLEELILDLLEGEFAGVIRSHVRGETYGGC